MAFRLQTKPNPCRRTSSGRIGQGASRSGCGPCRGRGVEGGAQPLYLFGISLEFSFGADKIGSADCARRVGVAAPFDPERRAAVAVPAAAIRPLRAGDAEREDEPAARRRALDPAVRRPRNGEIHVDAVGRDFGLAAVVMDDSDIPATGKKGLGPLGQGGVELDRGDPAGRARPARPGSRYSSRRRHGRCPRPASGRGPRGAWCAAPGGLLTPRAGSRATTRSWSSTTGSAPGRGGRRRTARTPSRAAALRSARAARRRRRLRSPDCRRRGSPASAGRRRAAPRRALRGRGHWRWLRPERGGGWPRRRPLVERRAGGE
jgi:hypothetical protein